MFFILPISSFSADGFNFLERKITFGSTTEDFLSIYPEFKITNELSSETDKTFSYTIPGIDQDHQIIFNVSFNNSGLNVFEMKSTVSDGSDQNIINSILKQFKIIPAKKSDEEDIGDVVEEYKKGKLKAMAFSGGFFQLTITLSN